MDKLVWVSIADGVKDFVTAIGIVVAGVWAFLRFGWRREGKTAVGMEFSYRCVPQNEGKWLVFFGVTITNKGYVKVVAKRDRPTFTDNSETRQYSGDLL